jgi:radical SAM superfamily enzyme YgiQ (UPF0313 family)
MKILLLNIKSRSSRKCINKDLAGGMGTGTWVGNSFLARLFERVKRTNVILPEIAVAYLSAIFENFGWEVVLGEVNGGEIKIKRAGVDLVLVPVSIVDWRHELEVIRKLKREGFYVGVYGTFATAMPDLFLADADFVIKGEPESAALRIIKEARLPKGLFEVAPVQDIENLPYPDWHDFPINNYSYSPALNKKPVLLMLGSRGCPYSCSFYCPYSINSGKKIRQRSPQSLLEEMIYLKKEYGVRAIDFRDPIFTLNRERVLEFSEKLAAKKLGIIWSCETRLDSLDEKLILAMKAAGLRHLNSGIESFNETVLKKSQRLPIAIEHQEKIIKFCRKNGISMAIFYIIGMEDDTKESILQTIDYAKKLNTLVAQFSISTPYPGTLFFEQLKEEQRIETFDWEEYDSYTPVFRHKNLSRQDLLSLKEQAFVSYYFRPGYLLRHMSKYFFEKFLWPF